MFSQLTRAGLRTSSASPLAFAAVSRPQLQSALAARSWRGYASDKHGEPDGKAKLAFRFGMKDVPVELWPMFVIVAMAVVGGSFAIGKQCLWWCVLLTQYLRCPQSVYDGQATRLLPTAFQSKPKPVEH